MTLREKLAEGRFVTLVELEPPRGTDCAAFVANAQAVREAADAFVVPDMRYAVVGMASWGGALMLQQKGMTSVMHISARDRNRLALQADLLAAYALGIENLVVFRGEAASGGDQQTAKEVWDLQHEELLEAIHQLGQGHDLAGNALHGAPEFLLGSSLNLWTAGRLGGQVEEMQRKEAAGAEFFITPPAFDVDSLIAFREKLQGRDIKIIPNVLVLKSVAMAQALRLHAKQIHMPDGLISRIKKAKERVEECLLIAEELVRGIRDAGFSGVMISPAGWESHLPGLLKKIG